MSFPHGRNTRKLLFDKPGQAHVNWRVARSLDTLRDQLDARAPTRSRAEDGSIGDAAHAARKSDHNPDQFGIVRARDYTHDPTGGLDCQWLATQLTRYGDRRISYVIWDRYIWTRRDGWRPYSGPNLHTKHLHLSVVARDAADDTTPWALGGEDVDANQAKQLDETWRTIVTGVGYDKTALARNLASVVEQVKAAVGAPAPVELSETQLDDLADRVAARLQTLRFEAH